MRRTMWMVAVILGLLPLGGGLTHAQSGGAPLDRTPGDAECRPPVTSGRPEPSRQHRARHAGKADRGPDHEQQLPEACAVASPERRRASLSGDAFFTKALATVIALTTLPAVAQTPAIDWGEQYAYTLGLLSNCHAAGQLLVSMVVTQSRAPLTSGCSGRRWRAAAEPRRSAEGNCVFSAARRMVHPQIMPQAQSLPETSGSSTGSPGSE